MTFLDENSSSQHWCSVQSASSSGASPQHARPPIIASFQSKHALVEIALQVICGVQICAHPLPVCALLMQVFNDVGRRRMRSTFRWWSWLLAWPHLYYSSRYGRCRRPYFRPSKRSTLHSPVKSLLDYLHFTTDTCCTCSPLSSTRCNRRSQISDRPRLSRACKERGSVTPSFRI